MKKTEEVDVVKVEKIVIKISGKEVEYSLEEAKKLQELLNNLLGNKETIYIPYYPYSQPYPYTYPTWTVIGTSNINVPVTPFITCTYNAA
jgi:hypothetical protein